MLGAAGAGVVGAGALRAGPAAGQPVDPGIGDVPSAASATETAGRWRMSQKERILFPVATDAPLVVLDNFGGYSTMHGCGGHRGVDIFRADATTGQTLVACVDAVLVAKRINAPGQGHAWVLEDVNGDVYRYHHLDEFEAGLAVGDRVRAGDVLGTMGHTGNASVAGPHLHFEVRRGGTTGPAVDPVPLFGLPLASAAEHVELQAAGGC